MSLRSGGDLQDALDKRVIRDVLVRYSRGIDRLDAELVRSAFHDDALVANPGQDAAGVEPGRVALARDDHDDRSLHYVTNEFIQLDGDTARCESYWRALRVRFDGEDSHVSDAFGRYVDRFERRAGEWKIARRIVVVESGDTRRVAGPRRPPPTFPPHRSRDDLSYSREAG